MDEILKQVIEIASNKEMSEEARISGLTKVIKVMPFGEIRTRLVNDLKRAGDNKKKIIEVLDTALFHLNRV